MVLETLVKKRPQLLHLPFDLGEIEKLTFSLITKISRIYIEFMPQIAEYLKQLACQTYVPDGLSNKATDAGAGL